MKMNKRLLDVRCFVENVRSKNDPLEPLDAWIEKCATCGKGPLPIIQCFYQSLNDDNEEIVCCNCNEDEEEYE